MGRMDNAIIIVVVVSALSLLCRDLADRQMVLRASEIGVLLGCPKILFVLSVTFRRRQSREVEREKDDDRNNPNDNDEG